MKVGFPPAVVSGQRRLPAKTAPVSTTAVATATALVAGPVPAQGMPPPAKAPSFTLPAGLRDRIFNRGDLSRLVEIAEELRARALAAERIQARGEEGELNGPGMTPDVLRRSAIEIACLMGVGPDYVDLALAEMARQLSDAEQAAKGRRELYAKCAGISDGVVVNEILEQLRMITGDGSHDIKFGRRGRNWSDSTTFGKGEKFEKLKVVKRNKRVIAKLKRGGFLLLKKVRVEKMRTECHDLLEISFGCFSHNKTIWVDVCSPDGFPVLAALTEWLSRVYPHVRVYLRDTPVGD